MSTSNELLDGDISQSEQEDYGQMYTVPIRNEKFETNLLNNVAAEDAVMDDIIGHMNTPMGPDDDDEEDRTPTTVEMQQIDTGVGGEDMPNVLMDAHNDQELDDINNRMGYIDANDDDLIHDINDNIVTAGNDMEGTEDEILDVAIEDMGDNDDLVDDIDDIHNNVITAAGDIVIMDENEPQYTKHDEDQGLIDDIDKDIMTMGAMNQDSDEDLDENHDMGNIETIGDNDDLIDDIDNNVMTAGGDIVIMDENEEDLNEQQYTKENEDEELVDDVNKDIVTMGALDEDADDNDIMNLIDNDEDIMDDHDENDDDILAGMSTMQ